MTEKNPVLGESYEEHLKRCEFCQFMQAKKQTLEDRRSEFLNALHSEDTMPSKDKKQTAEKRLNAELDLLFIGSLDIPESRRNLRKLINIRFVHARADEREKCVEEGLLPKAEIRKRMVREKRNDYQTGYAIGEEKGRRETAKEIFEELEERFSVLKKDHSAYWKQPLDSGWEITKAHFLPKEKEAKP